MAKTAKKARQTSQTLLPGPRVPFGRPNKGMRDTRAQLAALTARQPVDEAFKAAFIQSKIAMAHTHPLADLAAREAAVKSVINRLVPTFIES